MCLTVESMAWSEGSIHNDTDYYMYMWCLSLPLFAFLSFSLPISYLISEPSEWLETTP